MQFFRFWEVKNISKIYPIILAFLVVFPSNFRLLSYFNGPWGLFLSLLMLNFTLFWVQKKFKGYYPWTFLSFERPRILPKFASWFWCFWGGFPSRFHNTKEFDSWKQRGFMYYNNILISLAAFTNWILRGY